MNLVIASNQNCEYVSMTAWSKDCYMICEAELKFYRKMQLPIPRLHPDVRYQARMKLRNPRKLWTRSCQQCQQSLPTTYAPERPEQILCEACYLKVVN
ncbi:MAG TPA: hypothetical protein VIT68_00950 [Candidatus Gracilibacteria bacterium]